MRDIKHVHATRMWVGIATISGLLFAWAMFPGSAVADIPVTTPWGGNGSGNLPCNGTTHWNLTGFGNQDDEVTGAVTLNISGHGSFTMSKQGNHWHVFVNANLAAGITASATWTWDQSDSSRPTPVLTISSCSAGATTTMTSATTTTGTTTGATTGTTTGTTTGATTGTTTGTTTGSTTGATTGTTTSQGTTTQSSATTSVGPTTVTPGGSQTSPGGGVLGGTVTPAGGTAFTGLENVIPLGAIALALATAGSGLLWVSSRRGRDRDEA